MQIAKWCIRSTGQPPAKISQSVEANKHWSLTFPFAIGSCVRLMTLHQCNEYKAKGEKQVTKFIPCYDGPYTIVDTDKQHSIVTIKLPNALNIFPTFKVLLILAIREFVGITHKFTLCEWQRLTGWINWSLNMFSLLWPTLNNFYAKITSKCAPKKYIRINNAVHADLLWAIQHLESNPGVRLIYNLQWDISSADVILTNASASIHLYLKTQQTSRSSTLKLSVSYQQYTMPWISYMYPHCCRS